MTGAARRAASPPRGGDRPGPRASAPGLSGLPPVAEGLGLCVVLAGAGQALLALDGPLSPGAYAVAVPAAAVLLTALLPAGLAAAAGPEGAAYRREALGLRPGWTGLKEGLLVAVVGLVALEALEWALDAALGVGVGPVANVPAAVAARAAELVRAHPAAAVTVVVAGSVAQEVAFRGWGVLLVRRSRPSLALPALAASSLLFGAAHVVVPVGGLVHFTLVGLVFGAVALASGSVVPGALFHAGYNVLVVASIVFR